MGGAFDELMGTVTAEAGRFGHREHVKVTWFAVRRCGMPAAIGLVSEGIQRTARYAGAPQKYHATVSRAWVEIVAHHDEATGAADFDGFADANPELFDKRLLTRFYEPATLAAPAARTGWVAPDREPFPFPASPA